MLQIRLICFFLAFQYSVHQAQTLASIASSKVVPMIKIMKKLVKLISFIKSWSFGDVLVVSCIKLRGESPKHGSNAEVILMMTIK